MAPFVVLEDYLLENFEIIPTRLPALLVREMPTRTTPKLGTFLGRSLWVLLRSRPLLRFGLSSRLQKAKKLASLA